MSGNIATFKDVTGYDDPSIIKCYFPHYINPNAFRVSLDPDILLHLCDGCAELCEAQYAAAHDGDCVECELCNRSQQEIVADRMRNSDFSKRVMNKYKRSDRIASVSKLPRCSDDPVFCCNDWECGCRGLPINEESEDDSP